MLTLSPSHWLALAVVLAVAMLTLWPLVRLRLRHRRHHRHHRRPRRPQGPPLPSLRAMEAEHDARIREAYREAHACGAPRRAPWEKASRSR